jgi:hypothetical protein
MFIKNDDVNRIKEALRNVQTDSMDSQVNSKRVGKAMHKHSSDESEADPEAERF